MHDDWRGVNLAPPKHREGYGKVPAEVVPEKHYEYGIEGLAKVFKCSIPTANRIKKSGVIDAAITQVGRKIVVDVELALELAKKADGFTAMKK